MPRSARVTTTHPECDQCGQRIAFVVMLTSGKRVPIDPYPVADGNVCARPIGRHLRGYVISEARPANPSMRRYAAHFGTCPKRRNAIKAAHTEPTPTLFDGTTT